ncbi:hypothetical protein GGD61_007070 [Bradyrhizobium sp. SBR1B]|nr:hypothetical protein [Bradyrhizobium sp. SBR1B]
MQTADTFTLSGSLWIAVAAHTDCNHWVKRQ